jgi:hypothetical protein
MDDDGIPTPADPDEIRDRARIVEGRKRRSIPRPLADVATRLVEPTFRQQGFASAEVVTRWADIVGTELAAICEPVRIAWAPGPVDRLSEPATLVLRVAGPEAVEVQHLSTTILERVNQTLGWRAVGRLSIQRAPLQRTVEARPDRRPDPQAVERAAATLTDVADPNLRQALARLGAAITRR